MGDAQMFVEEITSSRPARQWFFDDSVAAIDAGSCQKIACYAIRETFSGAMNLCESGAVG